MGAINHDGEMPQIPNAMYEYLKAWGGCMTLVICKHPEEEEQTGVNFWAVASGVPRLGERIRLQNGVMCLVNDVIYNTVTVEGCPILTPHVFATLVS